MQPTLAYTIQGLQTKSPVTAFCFDQQIAYIAQTVDSATILTKCGLDAQTKTAQAASNAQITIPDLINVNSLDLLHQGQALIFIMTGWIISEQDESTQPVTARVTLNDALEQPDIQISQLTDLTAANITGTPMPQPVSKAMSALSSNGKELAIITIDRDLNLQASVYNVKKLNTLFDTLSEHQHTQISAADLRVIATVYQSFKPSQSQLDREQINQLISIGFSNGRALYATQQSADDAAIGKGFWGLKNGFHHQALDVQSDNLTGVQLKGDNVYYLNNPAGNAPQINQIAKAVWDE